ncbi:YceI family protein [Maricaulis sp.]|uniref:YceI family protein n=1 Tax=unclassified Maricaulis TaxID=2632371 RepID=UPI001B25A420|nr:YceI family protein [Maricaulis sp.]MBO6797225.1 polyisoprenoid-binding protein [Maricaulis sp.]
MRIRHLIPFAALVLSACITPVTAPARLPTGSWELDPSHTSVAWRVRHTGISWYVGRFDTMDASLDFDPASPETARLVATVDAASISTGDTEFDLDLANGWLNAGSSPQIRFESTQIEVISQASGRATGTLFLNGREIDTVMEIDFHGGVLNPFEQRRALGFSGRMQIDRTAFGIGNLPQSIVGADVFIEIEAEFLRTGALDD